MKTFRQIRRERKIAPKTEIFIDARDADVIIQYPNEPTEFDIQFKLYAELAAMCRASDQECEIKSEVTVRIDDSIRMRFDLMLFRQQDAVCAIEVKKKRGLNPNAHEKQIVKYSMFKRHTKIPVLYCYGMEQVYQTIKEARKHL
jgi:hypothetical protein